LRVTSVGRIFPRPKSIHPCLKLDSPLGGWTGFRFEWHFHRKKILVSKKELHVEFRAMDSVGVG
jgi:hypothetical protein